MLSKKLSNYVVILASSSPRRQQLLKDLNINFKVEKKEVEEIYPKELQRTEITDFLAALKAKPFQLTDNELLITSDTIVWCDNEALGKPKNNQEAFDIITKLSDNTHTVITSVSIKTAKTQKIINDTTAVTFKKLSSEEINYYIKNYQPYDKAGAYGIQEWIGKIGITEIKGSYFNVMGLPIHKLYEELMNL